MIKLLKGLWQVQQIKQAISRRNYAKAQRLIYARKKQGYQLSLLEQLFLENQTIQAELKQAQKLPSALYKDKASSHLPIKDKFIDQIITSFQLINHDHYKTQVTGIENLVFDGLEESLVDFLNEQITNGQSDKVKVKALMQQASDDLKNLKKGVDPQYNLQFSAYAYFIQYFLENVYSSYLAYFLIYQWGEFKQDLKILDIAAGPGTMLFGLALFLQSLGEYLDLTHFNSCYYSLEQQRQLQYRGLQFWRYYLGKLSQPMNVFYQFNTCNIFNYTGYGHKLPQKFFDLVIISHCFFYDSASREQSSEIYKSIFQTCLADDGRVLLVIQYNKLYRFFDVYPEEDVIREKQLIDLFVQSLGLRLIFYKLLTCTGKRVYDKHNFKDFADKNLPKQAKIFQVAQKYLDRAFISNYAIDDFIIYAQK